MVGHDGRIALQFGRELAPLSGAGGRAVHLPLVSREHDGGRLLGPDGAPSLVSEVHAIRSRLDHLPCVVSGELRRPGRLCHEYPRRLRGGGRLGTDRVCAEPAGGRRSRPVRLRLAAGAEPSPSSSFRYHVGEESGSDVRVLDAALLVVYPGQDHDRCHRARRPEVRVPAVRAGADSRGFERKAPRGYPHGSAAGRAALFALVRPPRDRKSVCGHAVLATVGFPVAHSDRRILLLVPAGAVQLIREAGLSGSGRSLRQGVEADPGRTDL